MYTQLIENKRVMETPAARLQKLMHEEQLNQVELSERIGKTKSLVSSYLNPQNKISDIFLRLLEDKLGWSARWIRTGQGPERIESKNTLNARQGGSNNQNLINQGSSHINQQGGGNKSFVDQLKELNQMHKEGALTDDEFQKAKEMLLT